MRSGEDAPFLSAGSVIPAWKDAAMRDDEFEPQLGRMRGRGKEQRYLRRVVKAAKRAGMKTGRRGRFGLIWTRSTVSLLQM